MKKWIGRSGLVIILAMALILAACGNNNDGNNNNNNNNNNNGNAAGNDNEVTENLGCEHIVGIEQGEGVVGAAEEAVDAYDLDVELIPSSSASMATSLQEAIENEEWVVVTGWTPHWKFAAFDLKYLDDPKEVFGGAESIHTIVREGLEDDHPEAYAVHDNFYWETDDMESIMLDIYENDTDPREAAQTWIDNNRDEVDGWIEGVDTVDGE